MCSLLIRSQDQSMNHRRGAMPREPAKGHQLMDDNLSHGELRKLSPDELQQITGGNAAMATGLSAIFAGFNAIVKAIEGVIVKASHNNPSVVSGINTFNQIGLGVENVAVGIASVI
jgi:hypothetical protein